jgi:ribokinase
VTSAAAMTYATELRARAGARGAAGVIVTLGRRGACVAAPDGATYAVPAFRVHAVDTTAAGDAFNAGLAVALVRGAALADAVRYASAVAAVSVTRPGAQPSMPTAAEVRRFIARSTSASPSRSRPETPPPPRRPSRR